MAAMIPKNNDMRFEVTTRCNYKCVICPREKITRKIETMGLEFFKYLFDKVTSETAQYDTLTFPGMGEPLLDKSLNKKIKYAKMKKRDMSVLILTNGSFLTPQRFRELEDLGVNSVRVSLYAHNSVSYAKIHGTKNRPQYDQIRDNLVEISRIKMNTKLLLTFNLVKEINDDSLSDWINFWSDKADLLEAWMPHNWVDAKSYRSLQKRMLNTCSRPFIGPLQVQVDGTVNMCCFDFNGKLTIGDLKKQSLKEIFSSDLYNKIVKCHKDGNFNKSNLICENCDQRNKNKDGVMIYNSKFDINERVKQISTTYKKILS